MREWMRRGRLIVTAGLLLATVACTEDRPSAAPPSAPPPAEPRVTTVSIEALAFTPNVVTVSVGSTVRWRNADPLDHDVTSGTSIIGRKARGLAETKFPDNKFSSGLFGQGKGFSMRFEAPGEYPYYCNIHPFMIGKVIVE